MIDLTAQRHRTRIYYSCCHLLRVARPRMQQHLVRDHGLSGAAALLVLQDAKDRLPAPPWPRIAQDPRPRCSRDGALLQSRTEQQTGLCDWCRSPRALCLRPPSLLVSGLA
jgi:hypothetical protein